MSAGSVNAPAAPSPDWALWRSTAKRRLHASTLRFASLLAILVAIAIVGTLIPGIRGSDTWNLVAVGLLLGFPAAAAAWGQRLLVRRRALRNVPRLDGAACPLCARPLLDPAQRPEQAGGASTMRCDTCERRWPIEALRAAWLATTARSLSLAKWDATFKLQGELAAPSPRPRLLGRLKPSLACWLLFIAAIGCAAWITGFVGIWSNALVPFVMVGVALLSAGLWGRAGEAPHCAKCDHRVTPSAEEAPRCAECGTALRVRGAIVRGERVRRPGVAAAGACVIALGAIVAVAPTAAMARGASVAPLLPTWLLIRCAARGGLVHQSAAQAELAARTLTPAEEASLAEAYIDGLRAPYNQYQVDAKGLEALAQRGRVSPELLARWYRESVEMELKAPSRVADGEPLALALAAKTYTGWGHAWAPWLAVAQVSIDGVTVEGVRSDALVQAAALTERPGEAPVAEARPMPLLIGTPGPGRHEIEVRMLLVILPSPTARVAIDWNADGTPILPSGALFVESIGLKRTVRVEGR